MNQQYTIIPYLLMTYELIINIIAEICIVAGKLC